MYNMRQIFCEKKIYFLDLLLVVLLPSAKESTVRNNQSEPGGGTVGGVLSIILVYV